MNNEDGKEVQQQAALLKHGKEEAQLQAVKSSLAAVFFHYQHTPALREFIESYLEGKGFSREEAFYAREEVRSSVGKCEGTASWHGISFP
jgi:ABC-type histidine transport system ATPase subunit